jgi:LPXTG-motif cell wall-anchored protein
MNIRHIHATRTSPTTSAVRTIAAPRARRSLRSFALASLATPLALAGAGAAHADTGSTVPPVSPITPTPVVPAPAPPPAPPAWISLLPPGVFLPVVPPAPPEPPEPPAPPAPPAPPDLSLLPDPSLEPSFGTPESEPAAPPTPSVELAPPLAPGPVPDELPFLPGGDGPECHEYDAGLFAVAVDPVTAEVSMSYGDPDVCDFTVFVALINSAVDAVVENWELSLAAIAGSDGFADTFDDVPCLWQVRVSVEESLPTSFDGMTTTCHDPDDSPGEPADPTDEPADPTGEPAQQQPPVPGDTQTPPSSSSSVTRLPSTGADSTTLLLGVGFLALGAGAIALLATRRRHEI